MGPKLDPSTLTPWKPKFVPKHMVMKPVEFGFNRMFSISEKLSSELSLSGASMGVDFHFDARQSLMSIAKMADTNLTRAMIQLEDQTEAMVVDIIAHDDVLVRTLPISGHRFGGEPMILVRVAYHTGNPSKPLKRTYKIVEAISKSMPEKGCLTVKSGKEEMSILKSFFDKNNAKLSEKFCKDLDITLTQSLLQIPGSYMSYICPLYPPKPEKSSKGPCQDCGAPGKKFCSQCKVARYCSKECQTRHWNASHKNDCKTPEENASGGSPNGSTDGMDLWVDIDPKKQPEEGIFVSSIVLHQNQRSRPKVADFLILAEKMVILKVQIQPGSSAKQGTPISIYPERKKFTLMCSPQTFETGQDGYTRLHQLVHQHGTDAGLGKGGCKAYLDGYVKSDGKLRIMTNKVKDLQSW